MTCMKYIELNPVRAKMVAQADDYPWSSYAANATGKPNAIISSHKLYSALAPTHNERLEVYRGLFRDKDKLQIIESIESSILSGTPLGSEQFLKTIEHSCHHSVGYQTQGRPVKKTTNNH